MDEDKMDGRCCLCGGPYADFGNNPWPVSELEDGRCCVACNETHVIPARLRLWALTEKEEQDGVR
jgi:hypothetical protein